MTPPRAVFEAVRLPNEFRDRAPDCPDPDFCMTEMCGICDHCVKGWAERTATAVLAAFFAGEVEGPWRVVFRHPDVGYLADPDDWVPAWYCQTGLETLGPIYDFGSSQADADEQLARRVAHALNYTATEGV